MGSIYRPRDRNIWWISYSRAGRRYAESSESTRKKDAQELLRLREGDIAHGKPVTPQIGRLTFEEAAADLINDYKVNGKRSLIVVARRVRKHLTPYFEGWRMANITTADARAFIAHRQRQGVVHHRTNERIGDVSNAEINRELALLKRMFSLAMQAGKLLYRPHIPLLQERNTRTGFFEPAQLGSVVAHLPPPIVAVIRFAAITGWRIASEVLPLQWRQVDFAAGEVRLDPETTKNRAGRVFPMTADLRQLLNTQQAEHDRLKRAGQIVPWVFFREVATCRGGPKEPRRIIAFGKAWKSACKAAGCPSRIPHDLRRTAVRNLVRAGIPQTVAMKLTGHKTDSVFRRYDIVSPNDLRVAVERLDAISLACQSR